jgi:hypothetical protein
VAKNSNFGVIEKYDNPKSSFENNYRRESP